MNVSRSDNDLFNRVQQGERGALNELFRRHYSRLCNFSNSFLNDRAEAQDTVTDVFLKIWLQASNIEIHLDIVPYLFICVRNESFARLKRQGKWSSALTDLDDAEMIAAPDQDPQRNLEMVELQQQMTSLIDSLPEGCRRIFRMSRHDQLSYKEIATVLGITEKTVENQISKALALLRERVQGAQGDSSPSYSVNI